MRFLASIVRISSICGSASTAGHPRPARAPIHGRPEARRVTPASPTNTPPRVHGKEPGPGPTLLVDRQRSDQYRHAPRSNAGRQVTTIIGDMEFTFTRPQGGNDAQGLTWIAHVRVCVTPSGYKDYVRGPPKGRPHSERYGAKFLARRAAPTSPLEGQGRPPPAPGRNVSDRVPVHAGRPRLLNSPAIPGCQGHPPVGGRTAK